MKERIITPQRVLQYPGSKWSYASWINSFIPPHEFYLEPFFGSGAVFFNKEKSANETINDKDDQVVNFYRVCRDYPKEITRAINFTPWSRTEFMNTLEDSAGGDRKLTGNPIEDARRFLVRCNQAFGNSTADRAWWKNSKTNKGPQNARAWNNLPDKILDVSERLKNAQIENTDGILLLKDCNHEDCFVYVDPPYPITLRKGRLYRYEMGEEKEHIRLLETLQAFKGKVIISGYDNDLYNKYLDGWEKQSKSGLTTRSGKCVEVIWMNYCSQITMDQL